MSESKRRLLPRPAAYLTVKLGGPDVFALMLSFLPVQDIFGYRVRPESERLLRDDEIRKIENHFWRHRAITTVGACNDALLRTDSVALFQYFERCYDDSFTQCIQW